MKKIIGGILGIFLVIGIVAGTGYALYSSSVTIDTAIFGTANTDLKIDAYFKSTGWVHGGTGDYSLDVRSMFLTRDLYPGETDWGHIKLINSSSPSIGLDLTARLTSYEGNWDELKDVLKMKICTVSGIEATSTTLCGDEYSLAQWNSSPRTLPGSPLLTTPQEYWVMVTLPIGVNPNTAGKTISNVSFLITGTQATE